MSVLPPGQKHIKRGSLTWWWQNRHANDPQQPITFEGLFLLCWPASLLSFLKVITHDHGLCRDHNFFNKFILTP